MGEPFSISASPYSSKTGISATLSAMYLQAYSGSMALERTSGQ